MWAGGAGLRSDHRLSLESCLRPPFFCVPWSGQSQLEHANAKHIRSHKLVCAKDSVRKHKPARANHCGVSRSACKSHAPTRRMCDRWTSNSTLHVNQLASDDPLAGFPAARIEAWPFFVVLPSNLVTCSTRMQEAFTHHTTVPVSCKKARTSNDCSERGRFDKQRGPQCWRLWHNAHAGVLVRRCHVHLHALTG